MPRAGRARKSRAARSGPRALGRGGELRVRCGLNASASRHPRRAGVAGGQGPAHRPKSEGPVRGHRQETPPGRPGAAPLRQDSYPQGSGSRSPPPESGSPSPEPHPYSRSSCAHRHERASSAHAAREGYGLATVFPCEEKGLAHRRSVNAQASRPWACSVEVLAAYSHSTQAADLRLCHAVALISPVYCSQPEREASVEPARPPR